MAPETVDMQAARENRSERLDVRATPAAKHLLQRAAQVQQRTVSEFVLQSALAAAAETLAERRHFELDNERWEAFLTALDAPPKPKPRLERLLKEPGVFD